MASNQPKTSSKYVTLVSSDGFEFVVLREAACVSGAIRRMLDGGKFPLALVARKAQELTLHYREMGRGRIWHLQIWGDQVRYVSIIYIIEKDSDIDEEQFRRLLKRREPSQTAKLSGMILLLNADTDPLSQLSEVVTLDVGFFYT